jgi:hypothetical protein
VRPWNSIATPVSWRSTTFLSTWMTAITWRGAPGIDPQARHLAYPQAVEQHPAARPQSRHGAVDLRARHYTLLSSAPRLLVDLETHNGVIMSPVS